MNAERIDEVARRAAVHAALADVTRLLVVDILSTGDASSSELTAALGVPSNLLAHHMRALEAVGLVSRQRSEGDARRAYLRLVPGAFDVLARARLASPRRLVFVCTANSARSHLAAALWARASDIPAASAGTHPACGIDPRAVAAAIRHELPLLPGAAPRLLDDVAEPGDLIVTVCDLAHEELRAPAQLHWSIPDPVRVGTASAFDAAHDLLSERVAALAPRLSAAS